MTINEFAGYFDKKATWWAANKGNDEVSSRARKMVDNGIYYLANRYHTNAQKLDDKRKASKDEYTKAAHYYKKHLDEFPEQRRRDVPGFAPRGPRGHLRGAVPGEQQARRQVPTATQRTASSTATAASTSLPTAPWFLERASALTFLI